MNANSFVVQHNMSRDPKRKHGVLAAAHHPEGLGALALDEPNASPVVLCCHVYISSISEAQCMRCPRLEHGELADSVLPKGAGQSERSTCYEDDGQHKLLPIQILSHLTIRGVVNRKGSLCRAFQRH